MWKDILYAVKISILQNYLYQFIRNKSRFKLLDIHPSVKIRRIGVFKYGRDVKVDESAIINVDKNCQLSIGDFSRIGRFVELGPYLSISIGKKVSIQDRSVIVGDISIGNYSFLSLNVLLTSGTHFYDLIPEILIQDQDLMYPAHSDHKKRSRPIKIEEDVWIGMNAVVMPGLTVGRGAVIGANSVVTRDVLPYEIVAGSPGRTIKKRFNFDPPNFISWNVQVHIPYFYSGFLLDFLEREQNKGLGGHVADGDFSIALNCGESKKIFLKIRSLGQSGIKMVGEEFLDVNSNWETLSFKVLGEKNIHNFFLTGDPVVVDTVSFN